MHASSGENKPLSLVYGSTCSIRYTNICVEGGAKGGRAKMLWQRVPSNKPSLCCRCHPADSAFHSSDILVHAICPPCRGEQISRKE